MIEILAAVLAQALSSPAALIEEESSLKSRLAFEERVDYPQKVAGHENLLYVEAALRLTFPGGDVISGGPRYGDLFTTGIGGGAQFDYLWKMSRTVYLGAYLEVDFDSFGGTTATDSFGNTIKPDTMNTFRILVGGKLREDLGAEGHFYAEQFLGVGANVYPSVKGTLTSGGVESTGELFGKKTAVAFDLGINVGWDVSRQVGLFLGFSVEINGGPGQGADFVFVSITGSSTPGIMVNAGINLGVNLRF
jgi:hypothetical protein